MKEHPEQKRSNEQSDEGGRVNELRPPSLQGLQSALMALWDAPELRIDKVSALRQAIQAGRYVVTNEQIAGAMLKEMAGR